MSAQVFDEAHLIESDLPLTLLETLNSGHNKSPESTRTPEALRPRCARSVFFVVGTRHHDGGELGGRVRL